MSFEVLDAGWASQIVDGGRPSTRSLGVPVGGAADRAALAIGNALVGNATDAPALEMCLSGPRLRATADVACVVYGAPFALTGPRGGTMLGKTFTHFAGEEVDFGGTPRGMRAYLCVRGGLHAAEILGSRSALHRLRRGDILSCDSAVIHARYSRQLLPAFCEQYVVRVVPGLQASAFAEESFYCQEFTISPECDRMGLRLLGQPLEVPAHEMVSEAVAPGAVQVTRDGQCIVLGVDGQTIGGYPKIAHVIRADLDRLGQLRPGQRIRFTRVSVPDAERLFRAQSALLRRWTLRLRGSSLST